MQKKEWIKDISDVLSQKSVGVFATERGGEVKARTVDYVSMNLNLGIFSWIETRKIADLKKNSRAAFCLDNLQFEGKAFVFQKEDAGIQNWIELYKVKLPELYQKFFYMENTVFIVFRTDSVKRMIFRDKALFIESLVLSNEEEKVEKLSDW